MQFRKSLRLAIPTLIISLGVALGGVASHAAPGDETVYYLLTDHLGSVDVVLDEDGNVVERRDYLPYGSERVTDVQPEAPDTAQGFTGKELDDETGLYYYGARYYDSEIGRFTAIDPWAGDITSPQSLNKYSYVHNNPIIFIDPTGMYGMESGEVEEGDTLESITKELNDYFGTDYSYEDIAFFNGIEDADQIQIGSFVYMGAYNDDGSAWLRSYDASEVTLDYWNGLNEAQQMITHYGRNLFQDALPSTVSEMKFWQWDSLGLAVAHNLAGATGNVDYRGKGLKLGQQAVYDENGNLVTSPENMGTYDFIPPTVSLSGHNAVDVDPWLNWGNSPQDSTSKWDRQKAYSLGILKTGQNLVQSLFE